MKIIEERKAFEDWSIRVECNGKEWRQNNKVPCGSLLEVDKDDIYEREWSKYPNYSGINYGFICPVCKCFTQIDESRLPEGIKTLAKKWNQYINS